jgi:DNA processing protein
MINVHTSRLESKRHWLALALAPGLSARRFHKLLAQWGSVTDIIQAKESHWPKFGLSEATCEYLRAPNWQRVDAHLDWESRDLNNHILLFSDEAYPAPLREIADPPSVLFIQGQLESLSTPQIAMVGSRNPTPIGRETAFAFAQALSHAGITITSGLALGIDAQSHRGALAANGLTVAVLGSGIDIIYPSGHRSLAAEISEKGALISEFPLGTPPSAKHFPQRNRIVSGLSLGTLVVEATDRSGSLITARLANEQGREVFAVPGPVDSRMSRGCTSGRSARNASATKKR